MNFSSGLCRGACAIAIKRFMATPGASTAGAGSVAARFGVGVKGDAAPHVDVVEVQRPIPVLVLTARAVAWRGKKSRSGNLQDCPGTLRWMFFAEQFDGATLV